MAGKLFRMSNVCKCCGELYFLDEILFLDVGLCPKCLKFFDRRLKKEVDEYEKEERKE